MRFSNQDIRRAKDFYENSFWAENKLVVGVDEVGRGCLCGPVVTAAVMLNPGKTSRKVKDSKLLDKTELLDGYNWIIKNSLFATSIVDHKIIDEINIYQATLKAMKRAVMQLSSISKKTDLILVDAMPLKIENTEVIYFPFGEKYSSSIAAASIIAKVTRDRIMERLDLLVPGYFMGQHKGYSTKLHGQTLELHGQSILHRKSFLKKFEFLEEQDHDDQQTLW